MVVDGDREDALRLVLADHEAVELPLEDVGRRHVRRREAAIGRRLLRLGAGATLVPGWLPGAAARVAPPTSGSLVVGGPSAPVITLLAVHERGSRPEGTDFSGPV